MPNLPGGETNILASLSRFASSGASAKIEGFDWGALVASSMIGKNTDRQRLQLKRFGDIRADLETWIAQTGLAAEHLQESAFYAAVATEPGTTRHEQAVALGRLIVWIYEVDDFMDFDLPARLGDMDDAGASRRLDNALARVFAPLHATLGRRAFQKLHPFATRAGRRAQAESPREPALIRSLEDLFARLPVTWAHLAPRASRSSRYRESLIARQLIACVRAMRHEFWWNRRLTQIETGATAGTSLHLPSVAEYENTGADSIGMCVGSAWATTCEPEPRSAWRAAAKVIDRSKRIVRLANDAYTYEADLASGKMSAITLELRAMGEPPGGRCGQQVPQARKRVERRLKTLWRSFALASKRLPASAQSYYLRHVVAVASAVYGAPAMG
jgi:hypothetical protein